MNVSPAGLAHLASFEGLSLKLYNDPAGNCTIGVGRLVHTGPCNGTVSELPYLDGITKVQAYEMLGEDVARFEDCVDQHVRVPINQNQFDALVSFAYNIGCGGLQNSTVLAALNAGNYGQVCAELAKYIRGNDGIVYPGLVRRREAECQLFKKAESEDVMTAAEKALLLEVAKGLQHQADVDKIFLAALQNLQKAVTALDGRQDRDEIVIPAIASGLDARIDALEAGG